jgi:lactoylglutathione lyase
MAATGFTHVTIYGDDLDELVQFYEDVFGLERIQAPNLGNPVAWLRCGDRQLHIVSRETEPPVSHHFSLAVDDFEAVFDLVRERDCFDEALAPEDGYPVYQLPDGAVQLYVRDPAGNLVEVDWPDVTTLDERIRAHVVDRSDVHPQSDAQSRASLFMDSTTEG